MARNTKNRFEKIISFFEDLQELISSVAIQLFTISSFILMLLLILFVIGKTVYENIHLIYTLFK